MSRFRVATLVLAVMMPLVARADEELDQARAHFVAGSKAYDVGDFDEAIREFSAAYKLKSSPPLLYNLGQAQRGAGHRAEALRAYRTYLGKMPDAPNRDEVERTIAILETEEATKPAPIVIPAPAPDLTVRAPLQRTPRRRWVVPVAVVGSVVVVGLAVGLGVGLGVHEHDPHAEQTVHLP